MEKLMCHMEEEGPMWAMGWNWFGIPYMGFVMLGVWLLFVVIAVFVYRDAESRGMNGLLWFVLVLIPWLGIIALVIYLIVREDAGSRGEKSPRALLDERYARGEITREEYLKMKKDIST